MLVANGNERSCRWVNIGLCGRCVHERVSPPLLQVIRILKELKQKYPDKELDQLVELANYYALLHQQKSRAFYRIQVATRSPFPSPGNTFQQTSSLFLSL